jgi:NAD(P)H-hydrate epimerase
MTVQPIIWSDLQSYLLPRIEESHKGDYGHSLIVGGCSTLLGAVMMAASAAARVGSGLTTVACAPTVSMLVPLAQPEIMSCPIDSPEQLEPLILKANTIAIGPGLGQDSWALGLLQKILMVDLPLVVDADALNLLAQRPQYNEHWILTPHPGEAARLLGVSPTSIEKDRYAAVEQLQKQYGGVIVLKGHKTLIACEKGVWKNQTGNPGMATGGMGDILTGVITGLVAQGVPFDKAALIGVFIHGKAGDLAAEKGQRGLLATDLLLFLRQLVNP